MCVLGDGTPLYHQTLGTYLTSAAPGTIQNRLRQAKAYLSFAVVYKVDFLRPSPIQAAMFAQLLANSHSSAASLKNYLSGAKHWITAHGGDPSVLASQPVQEVIRKLSSQLTTEPAQALPITATEIKIICQFLDSNDAYPVSVKSCLLLSYACMFRSSNVVSPSHRVWGGAHTLRATDIWVTLTGLKIVVRSTKTIKKNSKPVILHVYPAYDDCVCPVRAWVTYLRTVAPPSSGPAFLDHLNRPLTAGPVVSAIRAALTDAAYPNPKRYSMHSLRRGAVQQAELLGASHEDIMSHGLWRSQAGLSHYTLPVSAQVARLLATNPAL